MLQQVCFDSTSGWCLVLLFNREESQMFVPAIPPPGMPPPVRRTRSHDRSHSPALQLPPPLPLPLALPLLPPPAQQSSLSNEVGIFWDYENVCLPRGVEEAAAVAQRLARFANTLGGRVVELRLYHDSTKPTLHRPHRAALERLGFTIIDCPTSDKKEALDKKIIVDAMLYAVTRSAQRQRCGLLLVSGDGDYAHMLSRLRQVGVSTTVLHDARNSSRQLLEVCDRADDWQREMLMAQPQPPASASGDGRPPGKRQQAVSSKSPARKKLARAGRAKSPAKKPQAARARGNGAPKRPIFKKGRRPAVPAVAGKKVAGPKKK